MSKPWESFTNQAQWKEYLQNLVSTNDKALHRSIILLYQKQTEAERNMGDTIEHNGVGFSGIDGQFMGSLAEQLLARGTLSPRQTAIARNKMKKYWKQLMIISKGGQ